MNSLDLNKGWICPNCGKIFMTFPIFSGDMCNECFTPGLKPIYSIKEDLNKLKQKEKELKETLKEKAKQKEDKLKQLLNKISFPARTFEQEFNIYEGQLMYEIL